MSTEEKKELDAFAKELATLKRWATIIGVIISCAVVLVTCTHWFDNNIAQKSDIESLKKQQHEDQEKTKASLTDLKNSFDNYKESKTIADIKLNVRVDSLARITFFIQRHPLTKFVTESYPNGRNGNPELKRAN